MSKICQTLHTETLIFCLKLAYNMKYWHQYAIYEPLKWIKKGRNSSKANIIFIQSIGRGHTFWSCAKWRTIDYNKIHIFDQILFTLLIYDLWIRGTSWHWIYDTWTIYYLSYILSKMVQNTHPWWQTAACYLQIDIINL